MKLLHGRKVPKFTSLVRPWTPAWTISFTVSRSYPASCWVYTKLLSFQKIKTILTRSHDRPKNSSFLPIRTNLLPTDNSWKILQALPRETTPSDHPWANRGGSDQTALMCSLTRALPVWKWNPWICKQSSDIESSDWSGLSRESAQAIFLFLHVWYILTSKINLETWKTESCFT